MTSTEGALMKITTNMRGGDSDEGTEM